jgi:hypothetical protein
MRRLLPASLWIIKVIYLWHGTLSHIYPRDNFPAWDVYFKETLEPDGSRFYPKTDLYRKNVQNFVINLTS